MLLRLPSPFLPALRPRPAFPPSPQHRRRRSPLLRSFPRELGPDATTLYDPDELPVYHPFNKPKEEEEEEEEWTHEELHRRMWVDYGWAPWEDILTHEGNFAVAALRDTLGEEIPFTTPEANEAFRMLSPAYRQQRMERLGLSEMDVLRERTRTRHDAEPLRTLCEGPLVLRLVPPRDWPPPGWEVDPKELAFIREAHTLLSSRVDPRAEVRADTDSISQERYKVFVKQYKEWADANRDRLNEEAYKVDQDYFPGRRKRGDEYKEDMLELPFFFPGQICLGTVTTLHLYQGAFVDIGCVHDGWVPIKGNDWYWIRHHIAIDMPVTVEIIAKRDPYRFRFPLEMRFVHPNIDHLIFNRFDFPPIFHRDGDTNPDELLRSSGRPFLRRPRPPRTRKMENEPLLSDHPYVDKLWQLHNAEQMILDDEEATPEMYTKEYIDEMMNEEFDEENSVEFTKTYYEDALIPKVIININIKELNLDAARAERQLIKKQIKEAAERGEDYKFKNLRRNVEMDEYDYIHWRRSLEEREALIRDISCRTALGLPLEEPDRYEDQSAFEDEFDDDEDVKEDENKEDKTRRYGHIWYQTSLEEPNDTIPAPKPKTIAEEESDEYDDDDIDFSSLERIYIEEPLEKYDDDNDRGRSRRRSSGYGRRYDSGVVPEIIDHEIGDDSGSETVEPEIIDF